MPKLGLTCLPRLIVLFQILSRKFVLNTGTILKAKPGNVNPPTEKPSGNSPKGHYFLVFYMGGIGLEPTTFAMSTQRSNQLS